MLIRMKYLTKDRKTGNYTYRRAVPPELQKAVGKREINRSFGTKDLAQAQRRHHAVHEEVEAMLRTARSSASPVVDQLRYAEALRKLGYRVELPMDDPAVTQDERDHRIDLLNEMFDRDPMGEQGVEDEELRDPADRPKVELLVHGLNAIKRRPTLAEAVEVYFGEKGRTETERLVDRRWQNRYQRALALFCEVLPRGDQTRIDEVTRDDAKRFRDHLLKADYKNDTVKKYFGSLKAIFGQLFVVLEIDRHNPFANMDLRFSKKELAREKRSPLSAEAEALVRSAIPMMNRDAQFIVRVMLAVGCRVDEACHLERADIVLNEEVPYVHIRPNERNGWDIKGTFARRVPVVDPEALELLREFPDGPPRYQHEGGNGAASNYINVFLRKKGLRRDQKMSLYSARHTLQQKLLAVGAPDNVINEILGHSDGSAKEGYGDGLPLRVAAQWLRKALGFEPAAA